MGPNIQLLIHNVLAIGSAIASLGIAFFLFLNGYKKTANVTFALVFLCITIFFSSHVLGTNIINPVISKNVLMFNLIMFFLTAFNIHAFLAMIKKDGENKFLIFLFYISAIGLTVFFVLNPDLFLLNSKPKMYFPNYYIPGILNWVRVAFTYGVGFPYIVYLLYIAQKNASDAQEHAQYKYLIMTVVFGYIIGFVPNFLVYNIYIDPLWGMFAGLMFTVPFTYGAVKYGLFNIKVIARQAFVYSLAIIVIGGFITLLNYSNNWIEKFYPSFPTWTMSLISAIFVVSVAFVVWKRLRENDLLKYEFITTVTHKFMTPLTHIKWASENILKNAGQEDLQTQVKYIQSANAKLVELTNILANVSDEEDRTYKYLKSRSDISIAVKEILATLINLTMSKHIDLEKNIKPELFALYDDSRIRFVIQTLLDNSIQYTKDGGSISVSTIREGKYVGVSVRNKGIGIPKEELPHLFTKFYRGGPARAMDTEGMGIGLYISKQIIEHHNGKIWAESEGVGKDSTFIFLIPSTK